jgi:T5SS/PEP-CTERM-associated repeat protein
MKRERIALGTLVVMAVLVMFSGVAEADIDGVPGDNTTAGVYTMNGTHTIDGGSHWTHNDNLFKIGNRTTGSLTVSGGGWLELTATEVQVTDGDFIFQVGNQSGGIAHALVTGAGSKVTTVGDIQVGRNESGCTLTIEDGGLVVGEDVVLSRDSGSNNLLRMGAGGILAIEGTGKTATGQFWTTNGTGEMQYNPSGDGTTWVNIPGATGGGVDYTIADGTGDLAGYSVLTMASGGGSPGTLIIIQ